MLDEQKGILEAESLLEELGVDQLPIVPMEIAKSIDSDNFRVVMEEHEFDSAQILGKAQGNSSAALIYLNSKIRDPGRFNFTAAHEIGHVCMHIMPQEKMEFECGNKELSSAFDDPIERQANGFASGLLMPRRLITPYSEGDIDWRCIHRVSSICASSLEATFRRLMLLNRDPVALVIHHNGKFKRFVASDNFDFFIEKTPLSQDQREMLVDVKEDSYPSGFDQVDAADWVNPIYRGERLEYLYMSSILLKEGYSYTLVTYDDDCFAELEEDW